MGRAFRASAAARNAPDGGLDRGPYRAYDWGGREPKPAIAVTLSLAAGVRVGASFPGLDGFLLGAHPHWFTHSALPVWAVRKVSQKFDDYLRERERLVAAGELDEADRRRVEFERKMVRYVGAPLLGNSLRGRLAIFAQNSTGPIVARPSAGSRRQPRLDAVWLFGNGSLHQQGSSSA